jgi:hypothetical protein
MKKSGQSFLTAAPRVREKTSMERAHKLKVARRLSSKYVRWRTITSPSEARREASLP